MTGTVQECCGAPLPGPHPITGSMCYLLMPYGDIHHGVSYLLMPYSDIHTRQLFPVYTTMTDDYGTVSGMLWCTIAGATSHCRAVCLICLHCIGDIHGGISYLLMPYGNIHTRQLLPIYTRMIVASFNFTLRCYSLSETIQYKVTSSVYLTPPGGQATVACASCFLKISTSAFVFSKSSHSEVPSSLLQAAGTVTIIVFLQC